MTKPNGWEEFECSGPYCNHERSDKHYIVGEDVLFQAILSAEEANKITSETSDGYHTFNELYEFRKLYNACLFNQWADMDIYNVHKSKRHSEGDECFGGGWFIVTATLPTGQISNHYELKDWNLFRCEERERADKWDGHTAKDVAKRLVEFLSLPDQKELLKVKK